MLSNIIFSHNNFDFVPAINSTNHVKEASINLFASFDTLSGSVSLRGLDPILNIAACGSR